MELLHEVRLVGRRTQQCGLQVKATFLQAGMALDRAVHEAKTATSPSNDEQAWAKIQADGQHADHALKSMKFPLLSSIINADEALS